MRQLTRAEERERARRMASDEHEPTAPASDALEVLDAIAPAAPQPAPAAAAHAALLAVVARASSLGPGMVTLEAPATPREPSGPYRGCAVVEPLPVPRLVVRARGGLSFVVEVLLTLSVVCLLPGALMLVSRWVGPIVPVFVELSAIIAILVLAWKGLPFELVVEGDAVRITWDYPWGRQTRVLRGVSHAYVFRPAKDSPACHVRTRDHGDVALVRASQPRALVDELPELLDAYRAWLRERDAAAARE